MPDLTLLAWIQLTAAAFLIGGAKAAMPGVGILAVPMMAGVLGARASVGVVLPLLLIADCGAVALYRRHAQWGQLVRLLPGVGLGMALGAVILAWLAGAEGDALLRPAIGLLVVAMVGLHCGRQVWGEHLTPRSQVAVGAAGVAAGAATTIANAAGPVMGLYLAGSGLPKHAFMGTFAWFFLLLNLAKVPLYLLIDATAGGAALFTGPGLLLDLLLAPFVVVGILGGAWVFRHLPQRLFDHAVVILAALGGLRLLLP